MSIAVLDGFSRLLSEEKSSVEDFAVWVDDIIDKCFKKVLYLELTHTMELSTYSVELYRLLPII